MALVIDASFVAAWALEEEHANAELAFARVRTEEAFAPASWWYELRNVLVYGERGGRLTEPEPLASSAMFRAFASVWIGSPTTQRF